MNRWVAMNERAQSIQGHGTIERNNKYSQHELFHCRHINLEIHVNALAILNSFRKEINA